MEQSFDLSRVLRNHQKTHKKKPAQFKSVADGIQRRLINNLKYRKSSRLSSFDNVRAIPRSESPAAVPNILSKEEHRRLQLEKWKEEREKQKKEAAAKKKKPFVVGVVPAPLKFIPPPPVPKPSTSGRVTRSKTAKATSKSKEIKPTYTIEPISFAPKNASFRPPEIKNLATLPKLTSGRTKRDKKANITFDPVVPHVLNEIKLNTKPTVENGKSIRKEIDKPNKSKVTKPNPKKKVAKAAIQSSSSSEINQTVELSPILTRSSRKSLAVPKPTVIVNDTPKKPTLMESRAITPKNPVPKSESTSEEKLRSPKLLENTPMTPDEIAKEAKKISPCVTISRGKDNARKEMKKKLDEGLFEEDASDMDSVDYLRQQLASEIKRITEMCETWDKISEQTVLPENVQESVLAAVGQARLLMAQKLAQFGALLEACARPQPGHALVTPADLQGFWDMVFMQVVNVDIRFKNLEELRARGWVEEKPEEIKKKVVKPNVKKAVKSTNAPSRLRDVIAAARKAKKEQQQEPPAILLSTAGGDNKTFEAGFFSVTSPVRSPVRSPAVSSPGSGTPASKSSLLKAVLSNEAKKSASKASASFAMLRASVMGKNMEYEGIAPIPQTPMNPINLNATPGRSILKSSNKRMTRKSIKVVLFDQLCGESPDTTYQDAESEHSQINPEKHPDDTIDSMDLERAENKENSRRKSQLVRQDAVVWSPVQTRSRRKSIVDEVTPQRSGRKSIVDEVTPQRSGRKSIVDEVTPQRSGRKSIVDEVTPQRSGRKKVLQESAEKEQRPLRSCRRRKSEQKE